MSIIDFFKGSSAHRSRGRDRNAQLVARAMRRGIEAQVDVYDRKADTQKLFKNASKDWRVTSAVRADIRDLCRYEFINNPYIRGMVRTKQIDLIGTGPRLHIMFDDREVAAEIEQRFTEWMFDVSAVRKLRTLVFGWLIDGEGLAVIKTNPNARNPVTLDFVPIDPEQIPDMSDGQRVLEGIEYDDFGNAVSYYVLPRNPAGQDLVTDEDAEKVSANYVCHLYNRDRASQVRGLSELTSSLIPAGNLRSFTEAVLRAANVAASISFLVHTDEIGEDSTACEPYDVLDLEHGTGMVLPDGYKGSQLKAEQPVDTYSDFKTEILNEIGRSLLMPRLKISGDASNYNYSSGRLDSQEYYHGCDVEDREIEREVLTKLFSHWWQEATTLPGYLSEGARSVAKEGDYPAYPKHRWGWDGRPHVDPQKEATAETTRLANGSLGLHDLYGNRGQNCEDELAKAARALDVPLPEYKKMVFASIFSGATLPQEETDGQGEEAPTSESDSGEQSAK